MYDMALLKNLRKLGALAPAAWPAFQADAELGETILVAAALRAGGAVAHGAHCLKDEA